MRIHLSKITILGITFLMLGAILFSARFYLDELDKIIAEKSPYHLHCPYMGCPFPPQPYADAMLLLAYIGTISCSVGVVILSVSYTKQKTSVRQ